MVCTLIIYTLRRRILSSRLAWATHGDPVSKEKKKGHFRHVYIHMERLFTVY